jgi:hypothetical protein
VRKAIASSDELGEHDVRVFAQGSYRNRTNVRADSDVDICVCCMDVFIPDYSVSNGLTAAMVGNIPATYTQSAFIAAVGRALGAHFGAAQVRAGNKAFDVHANTYRVDADVVAAFEHRRYFRVGTDRFAYYSGTNLVPRIGMPIVNYPHHHYDCGVAKNTATHERFKGAARALKRLRLAMVGDNVAAAGPMASYLAECLVFNTPDAILMADNHLDRMRGVLAHVFGATEQTHTCEEWLEVSQLKYLFRASQPWTREQVNAFCVAAWGYLQR